MLITTILAFLIISSVSAEWEWEAYPGMTCSMPNTSIPIEQGRPYTCIIDLQPIEPKLPYRYPTPIKECKNPKLVNFLRDCYDEQHLIKNTTHPMRTYRTFECWTKHCDVLQEYLDCAHLTPPACAMAENDPLSCYRLGALQAVYDCHFRGFNIKNITIDAPRASAGALAVPMTLVTAAVMFAVAL